MKNIVESKMTKYDLSPTDQDLKKMCLKTDIDDINKKKIEGFH